MAVVVRKRVGGEPRGGGGGGAQARMVPGLAVNHVVVVVRKRVNGGETRGCGTQRKLYTED